MRGRNDRDGRGIEVESCALLVLCRAVCVRRETAQLSFRVRHSHVSREHTVALLRHEDGRELVACSLHLHPPGQVRKSYLEYLRPLREALEALAGVKKGLLQKECLLLGDFNVDPEQFRELSNSEFWRQCLVRSSSIRG